MTYQKPMLRQIEYWVQNGPITKNGVWPVTTLHFWKFCFSLRTSYKEMIWCTNDPNAHIRTFCRRWNFIWRYFFPVSILKRVQFYYLIVRNWRSHCSRSFYLYHWHNTCKEHVFSSCKHKVHAKVLKLCHPRKFNDKIYVKTCIRGKRYMRKLI